LVLWKNLNGDYDMKDLTHYTVLAEMFRYPTKGLDTHSERWRNIITQRVPELAFKLEPFISHIHEKHVSFQQEYYIRTFDVQAVCFLDIGYILYGEDYKRGVFLVNIKKEQDKAGNDCGYELADHLPNVLTLLPKLEDSKLAEELVFSLLIPSIHEMIAKFRSTSNFYKELLEILVAIMEADYPFSGYERFIFSPESKNNFLENYPQERDITEGCSV
jgi:nitrate reductase assembly molybdenum cofactor insertion protein NarJ